jgi:hypothetical protein
LYFCTSISQHLCFCTSCCRGIRPIRQYLYFCTSTSRQFCTSKATSKVGTSELCGSLLCWRTRYIHTSIHTYVC